MILALAKAGYGTIRDLQGSPVSTVLDAWDHLQFCNDYEETLHEINRKDA